MKQPWYKSAWLWGAFAVALMSLGPEVYPQALKKFWSGYFGASGFQSNPASAPTVDINPESKCPSETPEWREAYLIEGVAVRPSTICQADNPFTVAAAVKGTNNVSAETLMASGLTVDAVEKGADLDGDGDPDEIHIRLEVAELNGASPDGNGPMPSYELAPGIEPGFWVFAPKLAGMSTKNIESGEARPELRVPSPAIRVEQGDRVKITLENSHYMPHTLHLHGTDHAFVTVDGEGNDGVPIASEMPVMPGGARTYELQPRAAGTQFYHCHVQPHVHVMMGLQGLFVIEENRPDNWVQTLNIGAGHVRAPSVAVTEKYDREYDLHYTDVDKELAERIQRDNDVRRITRSMHRDYNVTQAHSEYFALNGRSFPYTFRESIVPVGPDELVKLRVVNGGRDGIALHSHGHKMTVTHRDGVASANVTRDVLWMATAQRLDIELNTRNDGIGAYGPGIWLFHDHGAKAITTDGIGPGGHISAIVYEEYLDQNGWPETRGVKWDPFFTSAYYRREIPVWQQYGGALFSDPVTEKVRWLRLLIFMLSAGVFVTVLIRRLRD